MRFCSVHASFLLLPFATACSNGDVDTPAAPLPQPSGATLISSVQGPGSVSPMEGGEVLVAGIVTGDFQDHDADNANNLGGFYIQQEVADDDDRTSEGVFVYDGDAAATDVNVGDRVEVSGRVQEHFGETQIDADTVRVTGTGTIEVSDVNLPTNSGASNSDGDSIADLERYEGMLVRFPQPLTVSSLRFLERFGEVRLSQGGRPYQFTNSNAPGAAAYDAHTAALGERTIILDDGLRQSNPAAVRYLNAGSAPDYSIRSGDRIAGVAGNLRYSRGSGGDGAENWRLMPRDNPIFDASNPRPGTPDIDGEIRVASFNALNFFTGIDSGQPLCGVDSNQNCRGADSAAEYSRQLQKTVAALVMMNADIIGLMEIENNGGESIAAIVDAMNARAGTDTYQFVDAGTDRADAIKTGFIYNTETVQTVGTHALLTASVDPRFNSSRNRPSLAQTFAAHASGATITVVVNHLKSKGSSCDEDGDINVGDGQGNCNLTRTSAAAALADWSLSDPTGSGDDDVLIIGDLNAYRMEDPLNELKSAGFTNLLDSVDNAYSFVFDGKAGALDHALASPSLLEQVSGIMEWHINADEPALLDYNLDNGRDADLFNPDTPYRTSDHDPVIVGLDLTP